jgi:uncharacterized protein YwqG
MNYKLDVELLPELEKYRNRLEASAKPFIEISPDPDSEVNWWQSKFGGLPYLPKGVEYPKNPDGEHLFLLAQINFAEVPPLEDFPEKGILQFYILDEHLLGVNYDNPTIQSDWRILHFPDPDTNEENLITNFDFLPEPQEMIEVLPQNGCCALKFEEKYVPTIIENCGAVSYCTADFALEDELYDEYREKFSPFGHKIGGVPRFDQNDQRPETLEEEDRYILLLQIDTDITINIGWGDGGAAHFFIKKLALKNLDFTEVIYEWDCG